MAKNQNRYIQFYTPGTAAVKVQIQNEQNWAPLPAPRPEDRKAVYIDPVAIAACLVAVCMLVMMAVGIGKLNESRREVAALERYVAQLAAENQTLTETYTSGYHLPEIRQKALDMGMIPASDASETTVYVTIPMPEAPEPATRWEQFTAYLSDLFA